MHHFRLKKKDKVILYLEKVTTNHFIKLYSLSKKDK